jgi:hypothetical protein
VTRPVLLALAALAAWVGITQWAVTPYCDDEVLA